MTISCRNTIIEGQDDVSTKNLIKPNSITKIDLTGLFKEYRISPQNTRYAISYSERFLFLYNGGSIFQFELPSLKFLDSLAFILEDTYEYCLVGKLNYIGILTFNREGQYDLSAEKEVVLFEFTESLKLNIADTFLTEKYYHLLTEDFKFVSYFMDTVDGKRNYWFNESYNYLQMVQDNKWISKRLPNSYIDINNGVVYNSEIDSNNISYLFSPIGKVMIKDIEFRLNSFSVIDNELVFLNGNGITLLKLQNGNSFNNLTKKINPVYRSKNHVYQLWNDSIFIWPSL